MDLLQALADSPVKGAWRLVDGVPVSVYIHPDDDTRYCIAVRNMAFMSIPATQVRTIPQHLHKVWIPIQQHAVKTA